MNLETARKALELPSWAFAKSTPDNPHEYMMERGWGGKKRKHSFISLCNFIKDNGLEETRYRSKTVKYSLDLGGYTYVVKNTPGKKMTVINRTINDVDQYSALAKEWDQYIDHEGYAFVLKILQRYRHSYVLDIGCGTGHLYSLFEPAKYIGIDSSKEMIEIASKKLWSLVFWNITYEKFIKEDFENGKPGIAVALFGSASYLNPVYLEKLKAKSHHQLLMFYKKGADIPWYKGREIAHFDTSRTVKDRFQYRGSYGIYEVYGNYIK